MNNGKAKHVIVISYDAFSVDNWELASQQPNLSKLIKNGVCSTKLKSVYPTLTYVVHTTMVTGVYPDKHGVYHNNPFQPFEQEKDQAWFWYRKDIKVPTIYDELEKYNMKAASILWPVTAKAPIHYNIPEVRAIKNENQMIKSLISGSPFYSLEMEVKFGRYRKGIKQPYLDDFSTKCVAETIKKYKPNLLLVHLIDLDDSKHEYGISSKEVEQVIVRMDKRFGEIIDAVEEAGIMDDSVFLILGDHGQLDVKYKIRLNLLLKEHGLIIEDDGDYEWRAYVQSTGGSAYIHIREGDFEAQKEVLALLEQVLQDESYGIERILSRKEMDELRIDDSINYMLEAKKGFCFEDDLSDPVIFDLSTSSIRYATHGYLPDKPDYSCNFVLSGNCINSNLSLDEISMVDIAPTIANLLGIDFHHCDGKALKDIYNN